MNKRNFLILMSLKKKIKSKWFIGINIFVFLMIMITLNISNIINMFGGDYKDFKTILVVDKVNIYDEFEKNVKGNNTYDKEKLDIKKTTEKIETLKEEVKNNSNIILLIINNSADNLISADLYTNNGISLANRSIIQSSLNVTKHNLAIASLNLTSEDMAKLNNNVSLKSNIISNSLKESVKDEEEILATIVVIVFILSFFLIIVNLVQMIGSEINEEKTTKSMEIIISNVKPSDHLVSKIVACTLFTMIQLSLFAIYGLIATAIRNSIAVPTTTSFMGNLLNEVSSTEIFKLAMQMLPFILVYFIITLVGYAMLSGVLASMTTSIDDFQQLQTPLMLLISTGFYLSILAMIFEGSIFIKAISYIPMISFLLSPTLFLLGQISVTSLLISVILQIIFTIFIFKYGFKVYKVGILNYSTDHLWSKMLKALKSN